jgi:hypothetical protein
VMIPNNRFTGISFLTSKTAAILHAGRLFAASQRDIALEFRNGLACTAAQLEIAPDFCTVLQPPRCKPPGR